MRKSSCLVCAGNNADGTCDVDSVWQKYDVRSTADSTADEQTRVTRKRGAFVTQRRLLLSTMWRW